MTGDAWHEENHPRDNKGRFKKGSFYNTGVFVDNKRKEDYNRKLTRATTSDGKRVKRASGHAIGRAIERGVAVKAIITCLTAAKPKISEKDETKLLYEKDEYRVVFSPKDGTIVSVVDRNRKRQREWKKKWEKISEIMLKKSSSSLKSESKK